MDLKEAGNFGAERHPWETARAAHFVRIAKEKGLFRGELAWLDVGSGDAYFASTLAAHAPPGANVTCWDAHYDDDRIAQLEARHPRLTFSRGEPEETFDVLLLLDVLEHIEDDRGVLAALVRQRLRKGGHVIMSVPAWMALYTSHDKFLEHFRRYSPRRAAELLEGAGLHIELHGGLFHTLLLPRAVRRLVELARPGAPQGAKGGAEWSAGAAVTRAVDVVLRADAELSFRAARLGLDLPGLSWWALCCKG